MQIWFRVPRAGTEPVVERRCPRCGGAQCHVHQHERQRRIVDWKLDTIDQLRVKCSRCGKTWTCRPEGIAAGLHRTSGVVAFGVLLYALGLSYSAAAAALRALTGAGGKTTVYRDVVRAGDRARRLHDRRKGGGVRFLGVDGTGQKMKGGRTGVAFAVDAEKGLLLGVELVEEENERQVVRFVKQLCRDYGVEVLITDEHGSYAKATRARSVQVAHRLCEAHWKKSKQLRLRNLRTEAKERGHQRLVRDLDTLRRLVRDRPDDAPRRIRRIHERYLEHRCPPLGRPWSLGYHMRMLALHLLDTWDRVGGEGPATNNTAERLIGLLLKIRSKTMRGFAKRENIPRFVHLMAYLWENRRNCPLRALC